MSEASQVVLERLGSLWERPRAPWSVLGAARSVPEASRNVLEYPSHGLLAPFRTSQSVPECLTEPFTMASKRSRKCLGRLEMPNCLHMAPRSRTSYSCTLPQVLVKIIPIMSIATGVIVTI